MESQKPTVGSIIRMDISSKEIREYQVTKITDSTLYVLLLSVTYQGNIPTIKYYVNWSIRANYNYVVIGKDEIITPTLGKLNLKKGTWLEKYGCYWQIVEANGDYTDNCYVMKSITCKHSWRALEMTPLFSYIWVSEAWAETNMDVVRKPKLCEDCL